MSAIHVACASEGASYVAHTAAMLHSVLAHSDGRAVQVHYLHGPEMSRRRRRRVGAMVEREGGAISFLCVPDSRLEGLPTRDFTRKATWYRIFLPELLPETDRILYLDSDLIAVDSLLPLWRVDLAGSYVAAVTNVLEPEYAQRPGQLGLEHPYFNAGVLLMNLEEMRRDGCTQALLEYGVEKQPLWRDQDALNVVLGHRRHELHPRWNAMNIFRFDWAAEVFGAEAVEAARRNPAIRHFEGPGDNKPWHRHCTRDDRELYMDHRRQTPWPRLRGPLLRG